MSTAFTPQGKVANLIVSCLSLAGGLSIIIGHFASNSGQNRLRRRLVLGLGVTDFILALVVIVGTSLSIEGQRFPTNGIECNIFGFFYQTCTVVSAAWTLTIAFVTYATLVHPLSKVTTALEKPYASVAVWIIVWAGGIIPGAVGATIWTMTDVGGICFYPNSTLEAKLMLFIPRGIAMLAVILFYGALFIFFQRRDLSLFQSSLTATVDEDEANGMTPTSRRRFSSIASWARRPSEMSQIGGHRNSLTPANADQERGPQLSAIQRPSLASEDTAFLPPAPPTRRSSAVVISLPPPSAFGRGRDHADHDHDTGLEIDHGPDPSTSDETSANGETPPSFEPAMTYDKRPSAGGESAFAHSSYRINARNPDSSGNQGAREKAPRMLSARQLNRRLSLLMSLYPLAYFVLFSVSLARLITQLATKKPVSPAFADVSRYLVLGQGFVDGVIYFLIELLFRRSVRGRT